MEIFTKLNCLKLLVITILV